MNSHQQQNMQKGSGLTRYRSAPSSYFASFGDVGLGADDLEWLLNPRSLSPETQTIFSRFMNSGGDSTQENCDSTQFLGPAKVEPEAMTSNDYSSEAVYQTLPPPPTNYAPPDNGIFPQTKIPRIGGANSSLIRHSSSPAGLFADINIQNEFGTRGGMDSITEIGSKGMGAVDDDMAGFPMNSWDDDFLRGLNDDDNKRPDDQKSKGMNRPTTLLSHHLSLPKSAMEKLLQDSVPCKIRAKRGCATHPRSIAERVRRTKISERMRKLQELVPNMEKQTNTSDMLDLAVDYIKDLQRQLKTLSDNREKCSCSAGSDG